MLHVIAYDVSSPLRLRRIAKTCEDHAIRIEKSLFECDLDEKGFLDLWKELTSLIEPDEDFLIAYPICKACSSSIKTAGLLKRPVKPIAYIF